MSCTLACCSVHGLPHWTVRVDARERSWQELGWHVHILVQNLFDTTFMLPFLLHIFSVLSILLPSHSSSIFSFVNYIDNIHRHNCRLLILASAQTWLICPNSVTGETTAFTSQCKLHKGRNCIRNYDTHIIVCSARILDTMWFLKDFCFISLLYFNQLDTTSKVMYGHKIMCTGNTV